MDVNVLENIQLANHNRVYLQDSDRGQWPHRHFPHSDSFFQPTLSLEQVLVKWAPSKTFGIGREFAWPTARAVHTFAESE